MVQFLTRYDGEVSEPRGAPGKSGLHASGEGERVIALESLEGNMASRGVEEGLSRSLSGLAEHQSE